MESWGTFATKTQSSDEKTLVPQCLPVIVNQRVPSSHKAKTDNSSFLPLWWFVLICTIFLIDLLEMAEHFGPEVNGIDDCWSQ